LGELLVTAVQVTDHSVDGHDRFAFEREDGAEHAVRGRVLRPHVHREALAAPVADLYSSCRRSAFGGLRRSTVGRRLLGCHFIGDTVVGISTVDCMLISSGSALPRNACQSGSPSALARIAARSLRSL